MRFHDPGRDGRTRCWIDELCRVKCVGLDVADLLHSQVVGDSDRSLALSLRLDLYSVNSNVRIIISLPFDKFSNPRVVINESAGSCQNCIGVSDCLCAACWVRESVQFILGQSLRDTVELVGNCNWYNQAVLRAARDLDGYWE